MSIYPWQAQQWQQLITRKDEQRLPHALLFVGAAGIGKRDFAVTFAHALLCGKQNAPCGNCSACHLINAQSHPDLLLVEPDQAGHMIKIDQIRELVCRVHETTQQGGLRVIIINPATAMNINAANALLKTLEEPAPNTIIILISDKSLRLAATILSRCQKIIFNTPTDEEALQWLRTQSLEGVQDIKLLLSLANGAPLKAKEFSGNGMLALRQELYQSLAKLAQRQADPLQVAALHQDQDMVVLLNLMFVWLQDLLRFQLTQGDAELINFDYQPVFAKLAAVYSQAKLLLFLDHVKKLYGYMLSSLNLNKQLLLNYFRPRH